MSVSGSEAPPKRQQGRQFRLGLDTLDIQIAKFIREAEARGEKWTLREASEATGAKYATVVERVRRLYRLGEIEDKRDRCHKDEGKRGRAPRRGMDDLDREILEVARDLAREKVNFAQREIGERLRRTPVEFTTIRVRIQRLQALGLWDVAPTVPNEKVPRLPTERVAWVESVFPMVCRIARRIAGKDGDVDALESQATWHLMRLATEYEGDDFREFRSLAQIHTIKHVKGYRIRLWRRECRGRSLSGAEGVVPSRPDHGRDQVDWDEQYGEMVALLEGREKEILEYAVEKEIDLVYAARLLGYSYKKAAPIIEWIRIKLAGYAGRPW